MRSPDGVHKVCSKCKETKLIGEFHKHRNKADGHHDTCKVCAAEWFKQNYVPRPKRVKHPRKPKPKRVIPERKIVKKFPPLQLPLPIMEEWRDIEGYGGKYQVSDMGRVRSHAYGYWYILKPNRVKRSQVEHVQLLENGIAQTRKVHRLVLEAFIGPCPEGMETLHGNGIPYDNRLSNLRWGTKSQNQLDKRKHGTAGFLTPENVREIRQAVRSGVPQKAMAERFGVGDGHISRIISGKKWRDLD